VPYSRSLYSSDRAASAGISADLIREFERWIHRKYAKSLGKRPLTASSCRDRATEMLAALTEGRADVAGRQHQGSR